MLLDEISNKQKIFYAIYALNAGLLVLKLFIVALSTGLVRKKAKVRDQIIEYEPL